MSILDWTSQKTNDFPSLDRERTLAVLPLGAVEQHGPHLPTGTDSRILAALLDRLRQERLDGGTALLLPQLPVGLSPEHTSFPGTLTIGAEALLATWVDLGACVARAGIGRLVLLTSHGGNAGLAEVAALRLRERYGLVAVSLLTHRLGVPESLIEPAEQRFGVHGGQIETALMQAIAPGDVDAAARGTFTSREPEIAALVEGLGAAGGAARLAWMAEDLHPSGAVGDARAATAEQGQLIFDHLVARVHAILEAVLRLPVSDRRPPLSR